MGVMKKRLNDDFHFFMRFVFTGFIVCLLSGCGFRLNNTHHLLEDFSSTHIQLQQKPSFSKFNRVFYALSKEAGLVMMPKNMTRSELPPGTLLLWLSEPRFSERPLSYSSDGQANYVMIELTLPYEIRDSTDKVLSSGPITLARPMSFSPNALLNNDSQRTLVIDALMQKACMQLFQRLSAHAGMSS
jgi:outer membrane lipopolysaccharide assembly protein LptE/RlpB